MEPWRAVYGILSQLRRGGSKLEPWRVCRPEVVDWHHFDVEQHPFPDPHKNEKSDPDPHQSEKRDPDRMRINTMRTRNIASILQYCIFIYNSFYDSFYEHILNTAGLVSLRQRENPVRT